MARTLEDALVEIDRIKNGLQPFVQYGDRISELETAMGQVKSILIPDVQKKQDADYPC